MQILVALSDAGIAGAVGSLHMRIRELSELTVDAAEEKVRSMLGVVVSWPAPSRCP
jgi:hypothetical protein